MSIHTKRTEIHPEPGKKSPSQAVVGKKETSSLTPPTESQLISFGDRITYVFTLGKEVGSIHFDKGRGEIFYKGHNIRNMDLEDWHCQILEKMRQVLDSDEKGKRFGESYASTLDKIILENRNSRRL